MLDLVSLLTALQQGDSFFPSGAVAFSHGLETLHADGKVTTDDVGRLIVGQLRGRWATSDRPVLAAAYRAGDDLDEVARADRLQDAITLAGELREGSRRAGAALLSVHSRLGTANAGAYWERVDNSQAPGHRSAVQGLVWRGTGLTLDRACAVSAHGLCVGLLGAALRLGLIGHIAAQRLLAELRPTLVGLLAMEAPSLEDVHGYDPVAEIAVMRHETQMSRLFSN